MIITLQTAGVGINIHAVRSVLNGLVPTNPKNFARYTDFQVSQSWVRSLHSRMNDYYKVFLGWGEITILSWNYPKSPPIKHPNELIINTDQSLSKFVATGNITMTAQGGKHESRYGETDKSAKTVALCESFDIVIPLFQPIYTGKTKRSFPNVHFLQGFCLAFN